MYLPSCTALQKTTEKSLRNHLVIVIYWYNDIIRITLNTIYFYSVLKRGVLMQTKSFKINNFARLQLKYLNFLYCVKRSQKLTTDEVSQYDDVNPLTLSKGGTCAVSLDLELRVMMHAYLRSPWLVSYSTERRMVSSERFARTL